VGNTVGLMDSPEAMWDKLRPAVTDPARQKKTDPGDPDKCAAIFPLHRAFSTDTTVAEVEANCRGAKWGCIDCKKVLHANMVAELTPIRSRAAELKTAPAAVDAAFAEGAEKARAVARATIADVKSRMGLPQ